MFVQKKTVFTGEHITTLSDTLPHAQAICVANGRIECAGSREDVLRYAAMGEYTVHDLGDGYLYPGFIDTHSHLSSYSLCMNQVYCGLSLGSIAGVKDALRSWAAEHPEEDWIVGYGFDDSGLPDNRHLTRHDLDEVSQTRPVFVVHITVHMGYANSVALQRLGITTGEEWPDTIVRDEHGEPTGFVLENALLAAMGRLPAMGPEKMRSSLARAISIYNAQGFTTIQDGGLGINGDSADFLAAYMDLAGNDALNARIYLQFLPQELDQLLTRGMRSIGSDYLKIGGAKFFADGSIQGFTGALLEDYHTRPGYRGELLWTEEEMEALIGKYHDLGLQVAVHTNGDAAIEAVLSVFEKVQKARPRPDLHHMMVHVQMASDSQLQRIRDCGILPTLFARHIEVWGDRHNAIYLGPERTARLDPAGSCVRLGIPFALHVDTPVLPVSALQSMHAAVNRVSSAGVLFGADQRITPRQALEAYTCNASLFCDGAADRGRIEPGRFADFVLLDQDLETVEPDRLNQTRVLKTICGGRVVYEA